MKSNHKIYRFHIMVLLVWSISSKTHNVTHDMFTYTSSKCHVNKPCQQSYVVMSLVDIHITTWVLFTWIVPSSWYVGCCSMIYLQWSRMSRFHYVGTMCFLRSITIYNSNSFVWNFYRSYLNIVLIHEGSCNFRESVIAHQQIWFDIPKKPKHKLSSCANEHK